MKKNIIYRQFLANKLCSPAIHTDMIMIINLGVALYRLKINYALHLQLTLPVGGMGWQEQEQYKKSTHISDQPPVK